MCVDCVNNCHIVRYAMTDDFTSTHILNTYEHTANNANACNFSAIQCESNQCFENGRFQLKQRTNSKHATSVRKKLLEASIICS